MIRGMLAALAVLGAVFVADVAIAEGPVCSSNASGVFRCGAGTTCCKVSAAVDKSGFKCCQASDRCVAGQGCFFQVTLRTDATWASAQRKSELQVVRDRVIEIPDTQDKLKVGDAFKRWVSKDVSMERVSRPGDSELGVVSGRFFVNDTFFTTGKTEQMNLLTFELGKALWHKINGEDTKVAQTAQGRAFKALAARYLSAMSVEELKSATFNGKRLGGLGDLDLQSQFGYAVRVALLNLDAPADASLSASRDWTKAREEMREFLVNTALK